MVPENNQFVDGESYYGTTFHEMIHSTSYYNRLNDWILYPVSVLILMLERNWLQNWEQQLLVQVTE
ncbi:MAG: hypothetical protein J1F31_06675 [Erysipelotrichales bacterium]|nr:hypothetical protein [Erysipelotrichales bacterium]